MVIKERSTKPSTSVEASLGSNPRLSARAVIISCNLLPYQKGYQSCRIALFVIGMQVRAGLVKEVQFLYGASRLRYALLIKLSGSLIATNINGSYLQGKVDTKPFEAKHSKRSRSPLVSRVC